MEKKIKVFTCGVDYQYELGETICITYASIESLKKNCTCWKECGIVELEVTLVKWVEPQNFKKHE